MIEIIIIGLIGYLIGAAVSWYVCKPMKAFTDGYNYAKDFYGDFERGFNAGWESAFKAIDEALFTPIEKLGKE